MPETKTHSGKALYISFILIQSLVYGIGNPLTKVAYYSITPLWLLAARFSLAFLLFALFFGRRLFSQLRKGPGPFGCLPPSAAQGPISPVTWPLTLPPPPT